MHPLMSSWRRLGAGLVLGAALFGAARAEVDRPTAESLLRQSGTWDQLAQVERQAREGVGATLAQMPRPPSDAERLRIDRSISQSYAPARLQATATDVVSTELSADDLPALRQWFASPLAGRIAALEVDADRRYGEADQLLSEGGRAFQQAGAERQRLLGRLMQVAGAVDGATQTAVDSALALQRGIAETAPRGAPRPSLAQLEAMLEAERPTMRRRAEALAHAQAAVSYAPLSDGELEQYIAFLSTSAGQRFVDAVQHAIHRALRNAAESLGRQLPATGDASNS